MALSNLLRLRLNIFDQYREFQESQQGDGSAIHFRLSSYPVSATGTQVYVNGVLQTETTDYTLDDDSGKLTFVVAPPDGQNVFVRGEASIFSDTELNDLLLQHSSDVRGATLHALRILMADYARREKWIAGDGGISVDPTKTIDGLKALLEEWKLDADSAALDEGGVEEWAVRQAEYR